MECHSVAMVLSKIWKISAKYFETIEFLYSGAIVTIFYVIQIDQI